MAIDNKIRAYMTLSGYGQGAAEGKYEHDHVYRTSGNFMNTFMDVTDSAVDIDSSGLSSANATIMITNHSTVADVEVLINGESNFAKISPKRAILWQNGSSQIDVKASGGGTTAEIEIMLVEA